MDYSLMFVDYREFEMDRFVDPETPEKTATKSRPRIDPITKKEEPPEDEVIIRYRHKITGKDGNVIENPGQFVVKTPPLTSRNGVVWKEKTKGNGDWKPFFPVNFDLKDPEQKRFVGRPSSIFRPEEMGEDGVEVEPEGVLGCLYTWCCEQFYNYRKYQKGSKSITRESVPETIPESLVLKRQVYGDGKTIKGPPAPTVDLIGKEVPGANPGKFLKIQMFGTKGTPNYKEAKFETPSGKFIKLEDLGNVRVTAELLVLYRHMWLGTLKGITGEITGAFITAVSQNSGGDVRLEVVRARWLDANPDVGTTVEDALARIRAEAKAAALEEQKSGKTLTLATVTSEDVDPDETVGNATAEEDDAAPTKVTARPRSALMKFQGLGTKTPVAIE
jgi:hypothetical protein